MVKDKIKELIKESESIHKNIEDFNNKYDEVIKEENKIIKSIDSSIEQKLEAYCNKNIRSLNSKINNLRSVNKKSPLLEFYRGKLQAYKNIMNMLEG